MEASALFSLGPGHLRTPDLVVICVYLLGITLFGLSFRKKGKGDEADRSLKSYFLAGNTIPWWAIGLSVVSAETSTLTVVSIPGVAFAGNFGFLQVVLGYLLGRIVVALLFLPRYFAGEMLTAYQLIDRRFGALLHKVTAGLFLLTRAAAEGIRVFAVSIVVGIAVGTGDIASIALISALTLLYTFEGGMAAVIWTDVVQMAIYVGGTLIALFTLGRHVPGGWSAIAHTASIAGKFNMLNFALNLTQSYTFWAGLLGGTFLTMASHGTDQLMVQRLLAARNLRESQWALLGSGVVIFAQFAFFLLIGAGLWVFYGQRLGPHAAAAFRSTDYIFPTFIVREMPVGVAGLLVAAILAAAMSNLSAALNSLSSTTVVDFYMGARPDATSRQRMLLSKSSTAFWAVVLFAVAVYSVRVGGKGHVVEIGLSIAAVAYGCLLGVFLLGTLTKFATEGGAALGMLCGFALNLWLWQGTFPVHLGPVTIPKIAFTWFVLIGAAATFAIGSLASLVLRRSPRKHPVPLTAALLLFLLSFPKGICVQSAEAQTPNSSNHNFTLVSQLINDAIAQGKLPGAVVQIGHGGQVVFHQAYGNRKLANEPGLNDEPSPAERMTEDTIFDMASLTKCIVTATAIGQLYESGKLDFDAPLERYLPAFNPKHDAQRSLVTVRLLLTHFSGEAPDIDLKDPWGLAAPDKAEGLRRALATPLASAPGTKFVYSDINFILLGFIVETLSGESLDVYARKHIFQPLGMTQTRYHAFANAFGPAQALGAAHSLVLNPHTMYDEFCSEPCWNTLDIRQTAPTAHDDEGTPATNPDFGRLLRGTVHDPTTRRMGGVAGHAGVFSTTHDMGLFAQALLDRLADRPSSFPLKGSTLLLLSTPEQPGHNPGQLPAANAAERTSLAGAPFFAPSAKGGVSGEARPNGDPNPKGTPDRLLAPNYPAVKGQTLRGFGWDVDSGYSKPRGRIFPIGSFGHTGFTGTSLWLDPGSNTYVLLLANAIHPHAGAAISNLRGEVASAAALALDLYGTPAKTRTGLDVLEDTHFAALAAFASPSTPFRLGLLTNQTGRDAGGRRTVDILATDLPKTLPNARLITLFSPEHGIVGRQDTEHMNAETDPATGLHVTSLYGPHESDKRPSHLQLRDLDAVVIDLQNVGVRFYTYDTVVGYFLEAAAAEKKTYGHDLKIVVLDRPDPLGGVAVQGPVSDAGLASYTDYMPLPIRYGMTIGELARYINGVQNLGAALTVVPMQSWKRDEFVDETGLPWIDPSPNLRSLAAAILYPGVALLEMTNVSVGRGTETPFELFGAGQTPTAPAWFHAAEVAATLNARSIPGVRFEPIHVTIADDANHYPFHGRTIEAVHVITTDRALLDSPELGIELLSTLHRLYPAQFQLAKAMRLVANQTTLDALARGDDPRTVASGWKSALDAFKRRRQPFLLYPAR